MNVDTGINANGEVHKAVNLGIELGTTGLQQSAGYVREEFLPALTGAKAITTYQEMSENDATVGAVIFSIDKLIRNVTWKAEGDNDEKVEFINECMGDMTTTWNDFISEVMSQIVYGWSYFEIVYKRRNGLVVNPIPTEEEIRNNKINPKGNNKNKTSKFDDGRIGWHKIAGRAQSSLSRWMIDDNGGIQGMYQRAWPHFIETFIPIEKALLFRTSMRNNNPEGRSVLRNAYRPWYFKKRIEEIEAVGIDRDLAGFPVIYVDPEILQLKNGAQHPHLQMYMDLVQNIRRDVQEGALLPSTFDGSGNQLVKLELLSAGGARQFDTNGIIERYKLDILSSVLADFIMLGHEATGSFALSADKTDIFAVALGAWLQTVAATINTYAVPRLLSLNGFDNEDEVLITPSDIDEIPLADVIAVLTGLNTLGAPIFPNRELQERLYKRMGLPMQSEEEEEIEQQNQEQNAALLQQAREAAVTQQEQQPTEAPEVEQSA